MREGKLFCQKLTHFTGNHYFKVNASVEIKRVYENCINVIVSSRNDVKKVASIPRENFIFVSPYYDFFICKLL